MPSPSDKERATKQRRSGLEYAAWIPILFVVFVCPGYGLAALLLWGICWLCDVRVSLLEFAGLVSVWIPAFVLSAAFPLTGGIIVAAFVATWWFTGRSPKFVAHISTSTLLDRIAWLAFAFGVWAMLRVAAVSVGSEGDGAFRDWDLIRFHRRLFFAFAAVAGVVPLSVAVIQCWKRGTVRKVRTFDEEFP